MSKTPQYIDEHGGEKVVDATSYTIYEDCDGDYWIVQNDESVLIASTRRDEFAEALGDAGLLPEEYTPDGESVEDLLEDPSPTPSDVAGSWLKITDSREKVAYAPEPDASVNGGVVDCDTILSDDFTRPPVFGGGRYNFVQLERVGAADVPFSEVPSDE